MVKSAVIRLKKIDATDGGATAIGGYVFQILATSSDQITAESFGGSNPYSDAVIYVHEAFDQDAAKASTLSDKVTLIQVKYSADASHNKINPSELDDISSRLQKSAKSAVNDGLAVTGFQLLSYRGLSDLAKKKLAKCRKDKTTFNPKKPTKKWVLAKLEEIALSEPAMKKKLHNFGASFGLRSPEIDKKIEHLTGKIFAEFARKKSHAMGLGDVRDVFLGTSDARKITRSSMGEQFKAEIAKIRSQVEGKHISRSRASRVLKENPTRALFVFLGQGGMGKSASLENLMKEELAAEDGSMLRAGKGADIPIDWAASCVDDWRRTPKVAGNVLAFHKRQRRVCQGRLCRL